VGYRALARVQQARGHGEAALATLNAFRQLARERQFFPLLLEQAAALRAQLQLMQGDLGAALRWADGSGLSPDDEISFPREAAHLTLARVRIAAGQAAAVLPLLSRLLADAEAKARMHSVVEILTLQALAMMPLRSAPTPRRRWNEPSPALNPTATSASSWTRAPPCAACWPSTGGRRRPGAGPAVSQTHRGCWPTSRRCWPPSPRG